MDEATPDQPETTPTDALPERAPSPLHLDLKKEEGLRIEWADGVESWYPIEYLRRLSPSADQRELRKAMGRNPLTVLPAAPSGMIKATGAEMIGNYAIRITFSDGHSTGIYSWGYLREIDPASVGNEGPRDDAAPHHDPLGLGPARP